MEYRDIVEVFNDRMLNENKKKRKKNCQKGNPYHGREGRFVDPKEDSGSWSLDKGAGSGKDCEHGQSKRPSRNKREVWTKRPCGRSGKYRCKDGTVKEDYVMGPSGEIMQPDLKHISDGDLVAEIERRMTEGSFNTDYVLKLCSAFNQAADGNYPPKPK